LIGDKAIELLPNTVGAPCTCVSLSNILDSLSTANPDVLNKTFYINAIGPLALAQTLLPQHLESSAPRIGDMSSRGGSVGDNIPGELYANRAFRAALNSNSRSLAMELQKEGVVVVIMH
jgi:NAD(P)-dependent dehydrogenase (short-subunit alcohol dehydrogenase family)